jgi:hypothetical protein
MAKPKITLYLDILSPFAYIAFETLQVSNPSFSRLLDRSYVSVHYDTVDKELWGRIIY